MNNNFEMNLEGNKMNFILLAEPINGVIAWATQTKTIFLKETKDGIYQYMTSHPILLIHSNLLNSNSFAGEMLLKDFQSAPLNGKALLFRDTINRLIKTTEELINKEDAFPMQLYVSYFTDDEDDLFINCMIENKMTIKIGVKTEATSDFLDMLRS